MFYELLTGFTPFESENLNDLQYKIMKGNYLFPKNIPVSLEAICFLDKCL